MTPEQLNNNVPKEEVRGVKEIFESNVAENETHLVGPLQERQKKEIEECQLKCQKDAFLETVAVFYEQLISRPVIVVINRKEETFAGEIITRGFRQIGTDDQPNYCVRDDHLEDCMRYQMHKKGPFFYKVLDKNRWGIPLVEGIDTDDVCVREDILAQLEKTIVDK